MKKNVILITALLVLVAMTTCSAYADSSIPATPETQGITTGIVVQATGRFSEDQDISWQISNSPLGSGLEYPGPSFSAGPYIGYMPGNIVLEEILGNGNNGGILYETVYSESTSAGSGTINYAKQFSADTGNMIQETNNIESGRSIAYIADTSGRLVSSENLMLDSAGQFSVADDVCTCPFASQTSEIIPQFSTRVEMGSELDISTGSVSTSAGERFVSATGDYPVTSDYGIRLTGIDELFASGSASASVDLLDHEGNVDIIAHIPFEDPYMGELYLLELGLGSEMRFEELSKVNGQIAVFEKEMHYESGTIR